MIPEDAGDRAHEEWRPVAGPSGDLEVALAGLDELSQAEDFGDDRRIATADKDLERLEPGARRRDLGCRVRADSVAGSGLLHDVRRVGVVFRGALDGDEPLASAGREGFVSI